MKKITLKQAFDILEEASAIIVDDSVVLYPALSDLTGEPDNEFMYLSWEDEGLGYSLEFNEGDNQEVEVVGASIFLYDAACERAGSPTRLEHTQITILKTANLEEEMK